MPGYRIAVIGTRGYPYVYSGYESFVRELAEGLVRKGYRITVYNHRNLFARRPREVNGIRLVYVPTVERKTLSQFIHSLQAMVHAGLGPYDLLFVLNSANGPLGLIPRMLGKKIAINVDGLEWKRPKWKGLGSRYFYWASKAATKLYHAVVTDSEAMRQIYLREFRCPSAMIAYGAQIRYSRNPGLIGRMGLEAGDYYLVVGRMIPDNNIDLMCAEFVRSSSSRRLVVVGDVPYADVYARKVRSLRDPRLLFTGYVRDPEVLAELYHGCFAYLHGHEFGGTNPALLTALGCGCAVFALNTAFNREVLADGRYGRFFAKTDLTRVIEEAERQPRQLDRLRATARERIAERYSWEKIVDQYHEFFDHMIRGG